MHIKDSLKLAAAVIGTSVTGRPPIHVSRKILPMRANYPTGEALAFTTRMVFDGAGRRIEELVLLSGNLRDQTRFYFAGQVEVERDGKKVTVAIPNVYYPQPIPIKAKTLTKAFQEYDRILHVIAAELQEKLDAAEQAEAEKAKTE